jgi:DNA-binding response OmpR family regulator
MVSFMVHSREQHYDPGRRTRKAKGPNRLGEFSDMIPHGRARFDRSIDVHMSSMRRKLGTMPDGRSWIQTIARRGYQLLAQ